MHALHVCARTKKITPIYGVKVRARRNPGLLNMEMKHQEEENLNPTYIISQVMLYNLESEYVGKASRGVNRMRIVVDRDHEEYAFSADDTLTSAKLKSGDYWTADSGASTHLTFDDRSMIKCQVHKCKGSHG